MRNNRFTYTDKSTYTVKRAGSILAVLIMAAVMMISMTAAAFADGEGSENSLMQGQGLEGGAYEVTNIDMKVSVGKDHTYDVVEEIVVNIPQTLQKIE